MLRIFCDFDGTVCPHDVGEQLFRKFAPEMARRITEEYVRGDIDARGQLRRACAAIPDIPAETFDAFVDGFQVDPHFPAFVEFCQLRGLEITILSDGLDRYVGRILERARLGHLPSFSNRVSFTAQNGRTTIGVDFPHTDAECTACGNCKRNHVLTLSADEDIVVYIGDGYSDRCPAKFADIVFARRDLLRFCQEQNITYHEFRHFGDVRERLERIVSRKRLHHRREAAMARRDAFIQEA